MVKDPLISRILDGEVSSEMIAVGFKAEDDADSRHATRADRISAIYGAMEAKRRDALLETPEALRTAQQPARQPRESPPQGAPSFRVPVYRARERNMS